ncbi:hypothetical protein GCM10010207_70600 [Streptomyces atratus]|nr:hypothetical protein GCM10010207_70600 [Streptomyces atratus]
MSAGRPGAAQALVEPLGALPSAGLRSVAEHMAQDGPGSRAELGGRGFGEGSASMVEAAVGQGAGPHMLLRPRHAPMVSHAT